MRNLFYILLFLFFIKPNFDTIPIASRAGDAVCIVLLGSVYLLTASKKIFDMKDKIVPFALLLFSYFTSILFCLSNFSRFVFADINEVFRVPLFMILPLFIGKYLVQGDEHLFTKFCRFFMMLYAWNLMVSVCQFFDVFNGIAYTMYSQQGLGKGSSRVTGITLFIQEYAWIMYLGTAVILAYNLKCQRKIVSGLVLSSPSFLTLSKTVYLSFVFMLFPFSYNKQGGFYGKKLLFNIIILLIIAGIGLYFLSNNLQFTASILEGFSGKSTSVTNRQRQIEHLLSRLNENRLGYVFGVDPILSKLGVRVETSFFNIFSKVGIPGTVAYYCCINLLMFVKQRGPFYIVFLKRLVMWIGISLSLVSVTGASIEGVKGMFFFFLVMGVLLSYNINKYEYSLRRG